VAVISDHYQPVLWHWCTFFWFQSIPPFSNQ